MRRHHVQLGSAALLTALAWPFARAQKPKLEHVPCTARFGQFDAQTAPIARCGTITVPQDRAAPNAPHLKPVVLPVVVYAGPGVRGTPVLFLDGGPGESAIAAVQQVLFQTPFGQLLLRERSLITFDRRGIPTDEHRTSPDLGFVDYQERYPRGPALSVLRDSVSHFAEALRTRGVAPRNFTTLAAVDDIADVLHALGINRVVVFGASYGSREALHFVRRHPEMVESMVLDGVAPPEATTLLDSATIVNSGRAIVSRIVDDCHKDEACRLDYADLQRAVDRLSADTTRALHRTANFPDNGGWRTLEARGAAILSVVGMASTWEAIRAEAPRVLVELASQDTLRTALAARVLAAAAADPTLSGVKEQRVPIVRYIAFCGDRPQGEPFAGDRRLCDALDVPFSGPEAIARVTTDVPILLISSGYDAQTPPRFAEATVGSLRHGYHVVFPMAGHIATVRPPAMACAAVVIESFLARPDRAPATECVSAVGPMFSARPSVGTPKVPQ
jgi:pimeloyl-ACP methyl ester carboxylesterase